MWKLKIVFAPPTWAFSFQSSIWSDFVANAPHSVCTPNENTYWLWNTLGLKVMGDGWCIINLLRCFSDCPSSERQLSTMLMSVKHPVHHRIYQFKYSILLKVSSLVYGSLAGIYYHILSKRETRNKGGEKLITKGIFHRIPWVALMAK